MLNILMYGEFGMEKTRTAILQFPKPMKVLDDEGGLLSVRDNLSPLDGQVFGTAGMYECTISPELGFSGRVEVLSFDSSKESYFQKLETLKLLRERKDFVTLVEDSGSETYRSVQGYTMQLPVSGKVADKQTDEDRREALYLPRVPVLNDWGPITERTRQVFRLIRDFKKTDKIVVCTCLSYIERDITSGVETGGFPALPGQCRTDIPALFDECWRLRSRRIVLKEGDEPQDIIFAQTAKSGIWHAKSRLGLKEFPISNVHKIVRKLCPDKVADVLAQTTT